MTKTILVLGDWSDDGHGQSDVFGFEVNKTVEEIQEAYKQSCKLTGLSFNHNEDYTEQFYDWEIKNNYYAATQYLCPFIRQLFYDKCEELDCPLLSKFVQRRYRCDTVYAFDENDSFKHFMDLWWWFVKLSLPDLEHEHCDSVPMDSPVINGYWNKGLNVQFGYGLYPE